MKKLLIVAISFIAITSCAQKNDDIPKEKTTLEQWNEEAQTNIRLLPKYGYAIKSEGQKDADKRFVESIMEKDSSAREASNHLIARGFDYIHEKDIKTAMYRFNQAFLLDSTNTDIYWGYGAVYFALNDMDAAKKQYTEGLAIEPNNTHLLTDYGTCLVFQYNDLIKTDKKKANEYLDSAIIVLTKSYNIDQKDNNTSFKLSACYLRKKDCTNARKYYDACKAAGGKPISEEYTKAINDRCK